MLWASNKIISFVINIGSQEVYKFYKSCKSISTDYFELTKISVCKTESIFIFDVFFSTYRFVHVTLIYVIVTFRNTFGFKLKHYLEGETTL